MTVRANGARAVSVVKLHVRTGDRVQIMSGDDRGMVAKVLRVLPKKRKVVVEGANRVYRHLRPSRRNPQGGRLSKEMPIDSSNVLLYCGTCDRGVKTGHRETKGQKERFCRRCERGLGFLGPPPERPAIPERGQKVAPSVLATPPMPDAAD